MIEAALALASRGLPIFPVARNKQPITVNGLLDATGDTETITRWWRARPDTGIGLRTGEPSRLVVLDVDGDEGHESLRELERSYEPLPATTSVTTPRRGQHYYFQWPGREVRNSASQIGVGLDIRGDGGYAVVPPSIGTNGRRYEWDDTSPAAPLPAWLNALITSDPTARKAATPVDTWITIVRDGLANGQRNVGLTRLVGHLLARDVDAYLVVAIAQLVNEARARPPLPADEVEKLVESIAGRELRKRTRRATA